MAASKTSCELEVGSTPLAQNLAQDEAETSSCSDEDELASDAKLVNRWEMRDGGVDGTRTRGLRRDRPAF
jgi:hypothetical protein